MNEYEGYVCAPGDAGKIAIIVARFNQTITEKLLEGALAKLREHMVAEDQISVVRVPGCFEIPTIAERFASDEDYIAVICLGCVIKGETSHDEHINRAVSLQLARIGAEYGIPVIFGVLTCNTVEQALARSGQLEVSKDKAVDVQPGNKGSEAAEAALEMIDLLGKLPELKYEDEDDDFAAESIERNAARYARGDFEPVDVDPNDLIEIDDEDEEDGGDWFFRGGDFARKPDAPSGKRDGGDRRGGNGGKPAKKGGGFGSGKPKSKFGGKPSSKDGGKKGGGKKFGR
ncbi:MAG: 6,7-dimethyl-8-ribityllumazine synthase [Thermoguttaceae bacterium]|nr:6,7-dimethyl-8-ribityllumazine synthase [Thermoguttaceae bacterium]